jgi:uncharacterized protein (TIGR03118 family)
MKIFQNLPLTGTLWGILFSSLALEPILEANHTHEGHHSHGGYTVTNLVSDLPGVAPHTDPNLIDSWGLTFDKQGNLVVADNGTSLSTSYAQDGTILSFVINVLSDPSGLESNLSPTDFVISNGSVSGPAQYLYVTEDGTILGFNPQVNPTSAIVVVDRSGFNAVYKGLALATVSGNQYLFAADFHNALINVFDNQFNFLGSFTDPSIPSGFAPFNIRNFFGKLYVTYAKQLPPDDHDDEAGPGNGFVDIFDPGTHAATRLVSNGNLNSPWGLALGSHNFGQFSGALLVGNFGDGHINAYDPFNGTFLGQLSDSSGNPIAIDGLWAIKFAPGKDGHEHHHHEHCGCEKHEAHKTANLFFTAGPNSESDGLVGVITPNHHSHD